MLQHNVNLQTTYNVSFGIQQDIGFNTVLDVAYVGSFGRHLQQARSLNSVPYGTNFQPSKHRCDNGPAPPGELPAAVPGLWQHPIQRVLVELQLPFDADYS